MDNSIVSGRAILARMEGEFTRSSQICGIIFVPVSKIVIAIIDNLLMPKQPIFTVKWYLKIAKNLSVLYSSHNIMVKTHKTFDEIEILPNQAFLYHDAVISLCKVVRNVKVGIQKVKSNH